MKRATFDGRPYVVSRQQCTLGVFHKLKMQADVTFSSSTAECWCATGWRPEH